MLDSHDTTSVLSSESRVLVVQRSEVTSKGVEVMLILFLDLSKSHTGGGLLVHELTETSLVLDKGIGHVLLATEDWEVENKLDGVDIAGDKDELGLVVLDERGDGAQTESVDGVGVTGLLVLASSGSFLLQSLGLLSLGLRLVFSQKLESFLGLVPLQSFLELGDLWWHTESLHEDLLLSLNSDVHRPLNKPRQILFVHDIAANAVVSRALLEESLVRGVSLA